MVASNRTTEAFEMDLVLRAICKRGYDFSNCARDTLRRRLKRSLITSRLTNLSELIPRILHDEGFLEEMLLELSVTVTEMFRDPHHCRAFREQVVPALHDYAHLKIWHAGCATGEEVYSMAIVLHEEGLLGRAQIYATDINERSLAIAQRGVMPLESMELYARNYRDSGGTKSLKEYFRGKYDSALMSSFLRDRILFSNHNLVSDGVFGEMNVVVCRNVLIYFDQKLQCRVLNLFKDSLAPRGFMCLGKSESVRAMSETNHFEKVAADRQIYRAIAKAL